ncbi:Membrane-anchored ribosome-binding protein, inhibits growth in stationary phase, ElaB/YqjD/DUF883 family [Cupriavidus sp. OV038]|jgi:ElaB/YqjD/DUF883 family membrane-anchored ribosome-binding protein|uniref:DUF883 family protein n=1 Tax=unclassified Cupriavidus TaxID=2640874 RepID=UPI0008F261B2|nr:MULTISPECIES: DUF883 family protein [unclassified Cupriavidus]SFC71985.1 Membrane-anchored ribosome-binding protein, inhibits growth in stationary phase, ElaB/YqjD/DUF883 family [Cupriavidus sp. OV038]SFO74652.1 Membrane-anchored ribosome-binding protein, inhibits growth in stationary phase, ElaB/YqjD/DUF883 family [Cupriavidus sp. OV096]
MLTQNPKVRKEINHLHDSADAAVRQLKHAARDTRDAARDAAVPVSGEVKALIAQLQQTIDVLTHEGSEEGLAAGRRLRMRANEMAERIRARGTDGMHWAREHMDEAVDHGRARVAESPLKAVGIAALIGACIGLLLAGRRSDE